MDKEAVVDIHNGILVIERNTFESVLMRWMNIEPIIHRKSIIHSKYYTQKE